MGVQTRQCSRIERYKSYQELSRLGLTQYSGSISTNCQTFHRSCPRLFGSRKKTTSFEDLFELENDLDKIPHFRLYRVKEAQVDFSNEVSRPELPGNRYVRLIPIVGINHRSGKKCKERLE